MKDNTEEKILDAARKVFITKGLDGARMQEIADEAGINKALLHYYFRTKQNLFDAVFEEAFFKLIPHVVNLLTLDIPFLERIEKAIDKYFDVINANPFIPLFVLHEINRDPDKLASLLKKQGVNPEKLKLIVEAEVKAGRIIDIRHEHLMLNIISMIVMSFAARPLFQRMFFENQEEQYEEFLKQRKQEITRFVINSIQKK
ncbi:MAG: TetR/AcrR family transcriptional regulator [Bacteroidota bacterium]|nr:TetR/AcrR family transcriptional regulator [Bacteroidota bacterium]MDP4207059.1 TetR/AcrR family transcriptional regulator [Bacteroidota bacterium]